MEVLSVQNQYQGQFGVIGSSKVKDWTSPLTPPPPPPPLPQHSSSQLQPTSKSISSNDNVAYKQRNSNSNNHRRESPHQLAEDEEQQLELYTEDAIEGGDVVDGGNWSAPEKQTEQLQQHYNHYNDHLHEQRQQQQHFYYNNHHYGGNHHTYNNYHQQHQHHANNYHHYRKEQQLQYNNHQQSYTEQQKQAAAKQQKPQQANSATTTTITKRQPMEATYNNNMFYYEPPAAAAITPTGTPTSGSCFGSATTDVDIAAVNELAHRVQTELRDAKKRHLDCTEVSLPYDLMPRIAAEIIKASEREPCGVRGCSLYIDFECDPGNVRRIASFKVDDCAVSTFELYLTLKQDKSGWTSLLPQFIKNLTRSNTILISPDFTLTKNKLYSCD